MINNIAIMALSESIKEAFVEELPTTLPQESRESIIESYGRVSDKIAHAVAVLVKKAATSVSMVPESIEYLMENAMINTVQIPVRDPGGAQIGAIEISGETLAQMFTDSLYGVSYTLWGVVK